MHVSKNWKTMSRKVFIDGGGHQATSLEFFLRNFPNAYQFQTHSFEINPDFEKCFKPHIDYKNHFFYNMAIWTEAGEIQFNKMNGESSTVSPYSYELNNATVRSIDFSKWLINNFQKEDYIVLKLDIEGAEFSVLPKMFADNSIDLIDELFIEFHYGKRKNTSIELSLNILEKLIFQYNLEPKRWNATGEDSSIDKIELDRRLCRDLEKEKPNSDFGLRWKKIKDYFGFEEYSKGMPIYSPKEKEKK